MIFGAMILGPRPSFVQSAEDFGIKRQLMSLGLTRYLDFVSPLCPARRGRFERQLMYLGSSRTLAASTSP